MESTGWCASPTVTRHDCESLRGRASRVDKHHAIVMTLHCGTMTSSSGRRAMDFIWDSAIVVRTRFSSRPSPHHHTRSSIDMASPDPIDSLRLMQNKSHVLQNKSRVPPRRHGTAVWVAQVRLHCRYTIRGAVERGHTLAMLAKSGNGILKFRTRTGHTHTARLLPSSELGLRGGCHLRRVPRTEVAVRGLGADVTLNIQDHATPCTPSAVPCLIYLIYIIVLQGGRCGAVRRWL
jgi:hypothetical protein